MQREDVYETTDLPESDQLPPSEEVFDSEHVVKVKLKTGEAFQQFKGKFLNTKDADFSDTIAGRRRKGYTGDSYFVELAKSNGSEPETAKEQYMRLQNEINELVAKVDRIKENEKTESNAESKAALVTLVEVSALQRHLKQLQIEQILGAEATDAILSSSSAGSFNKVIESIEKVKKSQATSETKESSSQQGAALTYEFYCPPSSVAKSTGAASDDLKRLTALEVKLANMEKLIGPDSDKIPALAAETKSKTLTEAVENLSQRISLLDNSQLDVVDARLSILLHKMSQVQDKKSNLDAEKSGKVEELYEMMRKWDSLCSSLPDIVSRLQSLKELHEQALQFSQCITYLDGVQQQLSKTLDTDSVLLAEVKDTVTKNLDVFKSNCESIDKRLKALSGEK